MSNKSIQEKKTKNQPREINQKFTADKEYNLQLILREMNRLNRIELNLYFPVFVLSPFYSDDCQ